MSKSERIEYLEQELAREKNNVKSLREELDLADEIHYDEINDVDSVNLWLLCVIAILAGWIYVL